MSEIRTLLLTDVVGSTQLSEALGDRRMADVWAAHDRAARDLLIAWRGREIDKTDGMLLLFDAVDDAVRYALAYQETLRAMPVPLEARAGIHTAAVLLRENCAEDIARGAKPLEVDGLAKPTAARVMSLAHGGQLLVTPEAREALGDPDALGLDVRSRGHWVMKGLSEPVEVFEVSRGVSTSAEPVDTEKVYRVVRSGERWLPVREIPNNLPQPVTSFVGREREIFDLKARLESARLITLLGMGGLGKTRLSLQVAEEIKHRFPDGVWFLDLSPLRDGALVASEAAQVLAVREEPDRAVVQTLCAALKLRRLLLVVDNCEHLLDAAGDLIDALLRGVPHLRVLASSREPLDVPGEQSYPIHPLPLPGTDDGLEALARSASVRLFADRARAHRPDFEIGQQEPGPLAQLVARLEGIPLAIELAAARMRSLEITEINEGLEQRYQILTGGSRRVQARHQTLRSLVDWSYDLLGEPEKMALQRLSVFVGGFELSAAQPVCGVEPVDPSDVPDLLRSLVEKSLVIRDGVDASSRYRMLETIREYARDKLESSGTAPETAARHAEHFFAFAKQAREGLKGSDQPLWIERLEADLDNVRAGTALALAEGVDPFIAVKMAVALQAFWVLRGYAAEGRAVIQAALALPAVQASDMARAHALYVGAVLASYQSDHRQARDMLQTCLELRRRAGRPVEIAAALSSLSMAMRRGGDIGAAAEHETEALEIFRSIGDRIGEAIGLQHLGEGAMALGDHGQARAQLEQALGLARQIAHREVEAECERMLGEIDFEQGRLVEARDRFECSLALCQAAGDKRNEANAVRWLGKSDLASGRVDSAAPRLAQALKAFQGFEMREELLGCLEDHAQLALMVGRPGLAVRLVAALEKARLRLALDRLPREQERWHSWLEGLRAELPQEVLDAASRDGRLWETAEVMRAALELSAAPSLESSVPWGEPRLGAAAD